MSDKRVLLISIILIVLLFGCEKNYKNDLIHVSAEIGYECALKGIPKEKMHKILDESFPRNIIIKGEN